MSESTSGSTAEELAALRAEVAALRERNDLLSAVIAYSPAVIFAKDREGRLTLYNNRYAAAFPHRSGDLTGMTDAQVFGDPDLAAVVVANDRRVMASGAAIEVEEQIPQPDGVHAYISIKFPLYDRDGEVTGIAGVATDITERKRAEDERTRLQQQIIDVQRATLSELSTPIVPIADGVIALPLIGAIDPERARQIMQALLDGLTASRAHTAILDITGVRAVDTQVAGALLQAARAARLLGAQVIITGIRPDVAQALVHLGTDWTGIETLATLQAAVALALTRR
jgi:rsbT co-antagonist protein RsbR